MAEQMTKDAIKKLDTKLECSICLDTFKQPKLLPCYHVFCKSPCLEKLVTKDGRSLTCPTCRHIVPLSERGVAGLQSDFHIDHLFEIRDAFDKAGNTNCENCEDGKATGYCCDCKNLVCDDCQGIHSKLKLTKSHKIVSLEKFEGTIPVSEKTASYCPKHPTKTLSLVCEACSVLICTHCAQGDHQGHNYELISDVFPHHKKDILLALEPLQQKIENAQTILLSIDSAVKKIQDQRATLEANIYKEIDEQHQLLDQRRTELVGELEMMTQQKLKRLAAQRDQVELSKANIVGCLEDTGSVLETGPEGELLTKKNALLQRIEEAVTNYLPEVISDTRADIELVTDGKNECQQNCREFLEIRKGGPVSFKNCHISGGVKNVVYVVAGEEQTIVFQAKNEQNELFEGRLKLGANVIHQNEPVNKPEIIKQRNGQYRIIYRPMKRGKHMLHITVNGHQFQDKPFSILVLPSSKQVQVVKKLDRVRGVAINSTGEMVVVNKNGTQISVLKPTGEKIRTFATQGTENGQLSNAYGVTVDKHDNIYVSDYGNSRIQKFNRGGQFVKAVGNKGHKALEFQLAVGICYNHVDNNLYVADQDNHRIQVLSTELEFVRALGTVGKHYGQFRQPIGCAFDSANNLYVTEWYNGRVQVLTRDGQFLSTFNDKTLYHPLSIAIDSNDTVFVSEQDKKHVSIFNTQGEYITAINMEERFENIYGLMTDQNDRLIVSDQNYGYLKVY